MLLFFPLATHLGVLRVDRRARRRRRRDEDVVHEEERDDDDAHDGEAEQQPVVRRGREVEPAVRLAGVDGEAPVPDHLDEHVDEEPEQRRRVDEESEQRLAGREAACADGHLDDALEAARPRPGRGVEAEARAAVGRLAEGLQAVAAWLGSGLGLGRGLGLGLG